MNTINLSYVLTTFNKFLYLQEVVTHLIANKKDDEEIIITDGKSTDGSIEWLKKLYSEGKINAFISEKDLGEAHGFNKAIMMAKGELIKIITADDIYYYPAINECKEFMLNHPSIDILYSATPTADLRQKGSISHYQDAIYDFETWKRKKTSFFYFNCITVMIRRSQIPKLGLLHTSFTMVDYEYSMRVSKVSNTALYTNPIAIRILNDTSNMVTMNDDKRLSEHLKVDFMYDKVKLKYIHDYSFNELISAMLKKIRYTIALRTRIKNLFGSKRSQMYDIPVFTIPSLIPDAFDYLYKWLEEENKKQNGKFIHS